MSSETEYNPAYDDYTSNEYPPDWEGRARDVRKRDRYTCQECGVKSTRVDDVYFDVDHIIPKSEGGSHRKSNLQSLCPACHAEKHPGNMDLSKRARKWKRRNKRSWAISLLRVVTVIPLLLSLLSNNPQTATDRSGRKVELTPIDSLSDLPPGRGVSIDVRLATLWDNSSNSIQQVGLLAPAGSTREDDTAVIKFVAWSGNNLNGSVESAEGSGIGRQNQCTEAGECCCGEDTLPLREAGGFTRSKAY